MCARSRRCHCSRDRWPCARDREAARPHLDKPLKDRLQAMKGLRIGITTPGATSDLFMRFLFRSVGMDPDHDLEIVPLGGVSIQVAATPGAAGSMDVPACRRSMC